MFSLRSMLFVRRPGLAILAFTVFVTYLGLGIIIPIRSLYAQSMHTPLVVIGLMTSAYLAANFLFQIPSGWVADRYGRMRVLRTGVAAHFVIVILYLVFPQPAALVVLRFLEGAAASMVLPAVRAYIADVVAPEERGEAYGGLGSVVAGAIFLGPAAGGFIAGGFGYQTPFIVSAVTTGVGWLLTMLFVREPTRVVVRRDASSPGTAVATRLLLNRPLAAAYVVTIGGNLGHGAVFVPLEHLVA